MPLNLPLSRYLFSLNSNHFNRQKVVIKNGKRINILNSFPTFCVGNFINVVIRILKIRENYEEQIYNQPTFYFLFIIDVLLSPAAGAQAGETK